MDLVGIVFFFAFIQTLAAFNCSICELGGHFISANGYGCYETLTETVICTCPDQQFRMNQRCRICDRDHVCGVSGATCVEQAFPGDYRFGCFCPNLIASIGRPCQMETTTQPTTTMNTTHGSVSTNVSTEAESNIVICKHATWKSGRIVAGSGKTGKSLRDIGSAYDFIVDELQNIYVVDKGNSRITRWKPGATTGELLGNALTTFGGSSNQFRSPTSIVMTANKDLIICDGMNRRIQRWAHNTLYGETLMSGVECKQLFIDENGELFFSTVNNELFKLLPSVNQATLVMKYETKYSLFAGSSMFLSRNRNLYIADTENNRILKYTPGESDAKVLAGGQAWQSSDLSHLNTPRAVIVDDKGTMYIAESGNKRIVRWVAGDSAGVVLQQVPAGIPESTVLRFDNYGNLYMAGYGAIIRFDIATNNCAAEEVGISILDNGPVIG